jgi:hypothetical protein
MFPLCRYQLEVTTYLLLYLNNVLVEFSIKELTISDVYPDPAENSGSLRICIHDIAHALLLTGLRSNANLKLDLRRLSCHSSG